MDAIEGVDSDHVAQIVTIHLFTKKLKKLWRKISSHHLFGLHNTCAYFVLEGIGRLSWVDSIV